MTDINARRRPQQDRSKIRVEAILDAALDVILEVGADGLAMREVARRIGAPISSVYQYFPSKTAILRELAERNLRSVSLMLQDELAALIVESGGRPTPAQAVDRLIGVYIEHYRDHPGATAVWAGAQADPVLRELDMFDNRRTAEFLTPALMLNLSITDYDSAFALGLVIAEVTGSVARLALAVPAPERERIIQKLKLMLVATLEAHLPPASAR